jgi:hypothetical protein
MLRNRLSRTLKNLSTNRQKKPGETNEDTSRLVGSTIGPTHCYLDDDDDGDDDLEKYAIAIDG